MVRVHKGKKIASYPAKIPPVTPPARALHQPPHDPHAHRVRHLLYLITFLLLILVLVVFFSFPLSYSPAPASLPSSSSYSLTIDSLSCQWQEQQFVVCETVSWKGPDVLFAKGYVPGGESLEASMPQTSSPFTYCQPVGTDEGYRVARALLYASGGLARDIGQGVACLGKEIVSQQPSLSQTFSATASAAFRIASPLSSSSRGKGMFTKKFPGKVESCTYTGQWITDNDRYNQRNFCHRATGTFTGSADAYEQYVINDPDLFRWAGLSRSALNPPAQRHEGYGFWMESCDGDYYRPGHIPRYGAQGTLQGFGTDTLLFDWTYFDESSRTAVDFTFDLTCTLRRT